MKIERAVIRGLEFLVQEQSKDGNFPLLYGPSCDDFSKGILRQSLFPTVCILNSLAVLGTPSWHQTPPDNVKPEIEGLVHAIGKKAASFLLSQKSPQWSWNYWVRDSEDAKTSPYPDDADDTALAFAGLYRYDRKLVNGRAIAHLVGLLTTLEQSEGGPYRTWMVPDSAGDVWKDIDVAVNANIGYFLSLFEIDLPNITNCIEQAIRDKRLISPYYFLPYPVWYFVSRWYRGDKRKILVNELADRCKKGCWEDAVLPTAMAVTTLVNMHQDIRASGYQGEFSTMDKVLSDAIQFIASKQRFDGSWPAYAMLRGKTERDGAWFAGSSALTTAFCLEALALYEASRRQGIEASGCQSVNVSSRQASDRQVKDVIVDNVIKQVKKQVTALKEPLRQVCLKELDKTVTGDKDHQIVLLPFVFRSMLKKQYQDQISDSLCVQLAMANLFGWTAYTIYDDFLDSEGNPVLLSVANYCLRELTLLFHDVLPGNSAYQKYYQHVLNTIDRANAWEVMETRCSHQPSAFSHQQKIPEYGDLVQLAEKSLGHGLGPITLFFVLGASPGDIKRLHTFFIHYLIARQLNDDAHDWEEDLKRGAINTVGARILIESRTLRPSRTRQESSVKRQKVKNQEQLKEVFWYKVAPSVADDVLTHVKKATAAVSKITVLCDVTPFLHILEKYEKAAIQMIEERKTTIEFLETYA